MFAYAGTNRLAPIEDIDEAAFDFLIGLTLRGMANTSINGAGKAALRALGVNLAPRKTRVNTITPGPIATNFGQNMNLNEK